MVDGRNMLVGAYPTIAKAETARIEALKEIEESDKILAAISKKED